MIVDEDQAGCRLLIRQNLPGAAAQRFRMLVKRSKGVRMPS